ncbi:unnamed protein product [Closterium sp. Yama58-4]|nr:unnamed protein product [Closterium sp. Yama58-4]
MPATWVKFLSGLPLVDAEAYLRSLPRLLPHPPAPQGVAAALADPERRAFLEVHIHPRHGIQYVGVAQDPGGSAAHRVLTHKRIMKVLFLLPLHPHKRKAMRWCQRVCQQGIVVGLRRFKYLAHKTDRAPKTAHFHPKAFFLALDSVAAWDLQQPHVFHPFTSAWDARAVFGNFDSCPNVPKLAARKAGMICNCVLVPFFFSARKTATNLSSSFVPPAFPRFLPPFFPPLPPLLPLCFSQFPCTCLPSHSIGLIFSRTYPMLDASTISPAMLQIADDETCEMRGFLGGVVVKGTLLVVQQMPSYVRPGVCILLRSSMVKVAAPLPDPASNHTGLSASILSPSQQSHHSHQSHQILQSQLQQAGSQPQVQQQLSSQPPCQPTGPLFSIEVNETTKEALPARLNRTVIALLERGGVPAHLFLDLVRSAAAAACAPVTEHKAAMKLLQESMRGHKRVVDPRDVQLACRMLLSTVDLRDAFIQRVLWRLQYSHIQSLASGKVEVPHCYYLMGVADPSNTLAPNEIVVLL